jgi:hypothetical protein
MNKSSFVIKLGAILIALAASNAAMAGVACETAKAKELKVYGAAKNNCANLTKVPDMSKNPYLYTSSNKCKLGLSMPGLPNFGTGGGLTACEAVRAVTGPMVSEANQVMQQTTNAAIAAAPQGALDAAANYQAAGGDLKVLADKTYGQAGSPTPSIKPPGTNGCPIGWICEN